MTLRELHGWTPTTVTLDASGEVVSVAATESRFTRTEVARLLAARRSSSEKRGSHGWKLSEATDPKNMGRFRLGEPVTDFAAKAEVEGMEKARKHYGDDMMKYLLMRVEKT